MYSPTEVDDRRATVPLLVRFAGGETGSWSVLVAVQEAVGRESATCAALIPIRKNAAWWVGRLRETEEWTYVEAETDLRLTR